MCLYFQVMCCESVGWCVGVPLGLLPQLFPSTLHCDLSHVVPTQNHIIIVIFIAAIIIIIIITRPKPAYGRQGLVRLLDQDTDQASTF